VKIAVVAPSPVPFTRGGAERALWGIQAAINDLTHHEAEMIKIPVDESTLPKVVASYRLFAELDLSHFDRIVTTKYPAWMVAHPHKTILMMHVLRGVYDTYWTHGQPLECHPRSSEVHELLQLIETRQDRAALADFFDRFDLALDALGPDHPDLAFPGPFSRLAIRWMDEIGMAPAEVQRYLSQSKTVADREGYFPRGIRPTIVNLPGHLPPAPKRPDAGSYLFTASRLDGPKRLDMLIDAMAYVPGDIELRIAGTGAQGEELRRRAAHDPRITFLGFTRNDQLPELYANALAVPFVPADEDLGLITLEAFSQSTAVVTCRDSGGPTEFIVDNETGLVADPHPASLGAALARLVADPAFAARLGEAGRIRGEQIVWQDVVDAILADPAEDRTDGPVGLHRHSQDLGVVGGFSPVRVRPPDPSRRRIVVLATFAIDHPRHGGQLRCRNLYGALTDLGEHGTDVEVIALVDHGHVHQRTHLAPGLDQVVVPRSPEHAAVAARLTQEAGTPVTDLVAGSHIAASPAYLAELRQALAGADAVILAEPYLLPALDAVGVEVPVVYDAYNVESDLKATVYPDTEVGRALLAEAADVERRAVLQAAHVTTCSAADADVLAERYGRPRADLTVIPNGTVIPEHIATGAERARLSARWRERYWRIGATGKMPAHLAVFFGSWHPPNIEAAELLIGVAEALPDLSILSVGHHGHAFEGRRVPDNIAFPGIVNDGARLRLLAAADVALNPMRSGSGTNLKLVEYLAMGIPIVSTPFGARGLEVVDGEHLVLAEPDRFAEVLSGVLADPESATRRAEAGRELAVASYGWPALGRRLDDVLAEVLGERPGGDHETDATSSDTVIARARQ
jgi:glycosyltransferase involved in cell wall biosynthesis